ncbi:MAG: formate dehydrogenase accessory sulfurtransferase FdhD [Vulcanimicrobiaceae bacterium]
MIDEPDSQRGSTRAVRALTFEHGQARTKFDQVATEEPLEIRAGSGGRMRPVAVTMRTPGHDFELAAGFLFAEGLVSGPDDITELTYCIDPQIDLQQRFNIVNVGLRHAPAERIEHLQRHFTVSSACGVCGRAQLDALEARGLQPIASDARVSVATILALAHDLAGRQRVFSQTGGLHAAAAFTLEGEIELVREDVGRHNAMDKLIGNAILAKRASLPERIALVSGRASFELVQKALSARIPILCAVSAPSSLAVDLAQRFDLTLIAFLRDARFNVYAGAQRIVT